MARTISTTAAKRSKYESAEIPSESPEGSDGYAARLLKYIPGETIVFFVSADRIIQSYLPSILASQNQPEGTTPDAAALANAAQSPSSLGLWLALGLFLICLISTPFYLRRVARVEKWGQIVISTIAFVVWAFTVGSEGFNRALHIEGPIWEMIRSLALLFFTFLVPIFVPGQSKNLQDSIDPAVPES